MRAERRRVSEGSVNSLTRKQGILKDIEMGAGNEYHSIDQSRSDPQAISMIPPGLQCGASPAWSGESLATRGQIACMMVGIQFDAEEHAAG